MPENPLILSANAHGCRLADAGMIRMPDYIVAVDDNLEPELRAWPVPIITQRDYSDVQLWRKPLHLSGILACWVAWLLGCAPVVPIGMDLYRGGRSSVYWDNPTAESAGAHVPVDQHRDFWRQVFGVIPDDIIRAPAGSALCELFPMFDPLEHFPVPAGDDETRRRFESSAGYLVRFVRRHPRMRGGGHYQPGDVVMMTARDARRSKREHIAEILDPIPETA